MPENVSAVVSVCGPYSVTRKWAYWEVKGPVPAHVARKLYDDPLGREVVRVGGWAGNLDPDEYFRLHPWTDVVDTYHIDTDEGFRLFNAVLREHGLV